MQLSIQRSRRMGGITGGTAFFCLDVCAEYDAEERDDINRYKIGPQIVYQSREAKKHLEAAKVRAAEGGWKNLMGSVVSVARGRIATNISIASLGRGHHVECKDMAELLEAEDELREASKNLTRYLQVAKTFNGQRVLISYVNGEEQVHIGPVGQPPLLIETTQRPALPTPSSMRESEGPSFPFLVGLEDRLREYYERAIEWVDEYRFQPMHLTVIIPILLAAVDWTVLELRPAQASVAVETAESAAPALPAGWVRASPATSALAIGAKYLLVREALIQQGWQHYDTYHGACGQARCPPYPETYHCSSPRRCAYVWHHDTGTETLWISARGADMSDQRVVLYVRCPLYPLYNSRTGWIGCK
jgi:hypothetical protein